MRYQKARYYIGDCYSGDCQYCYGLVLGAIFVDDVGGPIRFTKPNSLVEFKNDQGEWEKWK